MCGVCAGLPGYAWVCAGMHGFAQMWAGMRGYVQVCAGVCVDMHRCVHVRARVWD